MSQFPREISKAGAGLRRGQRAELGVGQRKGPRQTQGQEESQDRGRAEAKANDLLYK